MIIDIDRESRQGYARYLIDRPEDSYTILEGSANLFDTYANNLIQENSENPDFKPYYRMLLSFKEEDLTLSDLTEIYQNFKEKFFQNYDEDEYNLFSVIHWDDNKPHIHVGVISNSLVNQKNLRIMRGYHDVPRVDAIAETINYKYNLESAKESISLFPLTTEQKIRDWKVKKGKPFYNVPDDEIMVFLEKSAKNSNNFTDFIQNIQSKFQDIQIYEREFETNIDKDLKEKTLSIKLPSKKTHSFKSFLFNEKWFNKNIEKLKKLEHLSDFRASIKRENFDYYDQQFNRMSLNHKEELQKRKIHEGLLVHKLKNQLYTINTNGINPLETLDFSSLMIEDIEELNLQYQENNLTKEKNLLIKILQNTNSIEEIDLILSLTNYKLHRSKINESNKKEIIFTKKDSEEEIVVINDNIFTTANTTQNNLYSFFRDEILSKKEITLLNPNKREELNILKTTLLNNILKNAKSKNDLIVLLENLDIEILKLGEDKKKGPYISLQFKNKNFNLYSNMIHSIYTEHQREVDINKRANNDILNSTIKPIYNGIFKPESINDFILKNSITTPTTIKSFKNKKEITLLPTKELSISNRDSNQTYQLKNKNTTLILEKYREIDDFTADFLQDLIAKKVDYIKLGGDIATQNILIESLKKLSKIPNFYNIKKTTIFSPLYAEEIIIEDGLVRPKNPSKSTTKNETTQNQLQEQLSLIQENNSKITQSNKILELIESTKHLTYEKRAKKILNAVTQLDDPLLLNQVLCNLNLKIENLSNSEAVFVTTENESIKSKNILLIELLKIPKDDYISHFKEVTLDFIKSKSKKESDFKELRLKQAILIKLYKESFEKLPLLNYELKSEKESNKEIIYETKNSIILSSKNSIKIIKSKSIENALKEVDGLFGRKTQSAELNRNKEQLEHYKI